LEGEMVQSANLSSCVLGKGKRKKKTEGKRTSGEGECDAGRGLMEITFSIKHPKKTG